MSMIELTRNFLSSLLVGVSGIFFDNTLFGDPNALSFEPLLEWTYILMKVYSTYKAKKSKSLPSRTLPFPKPRRVNK